MTDRSPLLEVSGLSTELATEGRTVRAVDSVSFSVGRGEIVGLVGESGSGKSMTALSVLRLLPAAGRIVAGRVLFDGTDLVTLPEERMRAVRGRRIAMIFQDPMTSLNPYVRVGEQVAEGAVVHLGLSEAEALKKAVSLLEQVGIPDPAERARQHPHELSGGMRQRVMIAMALACDPELLVADEPTTALDVTIQAQILELVRGLVKTRGLSVLVVTHDLGVVGELTDRVLVMYAGRILESGPTGDVLARPLHPYTLALLRSMPALGGPKASRLSAIPGMPPRLDRGPFGECAFAPRCAFVHDACRRGDPALVPAGSGRERRCVLPEEDVR
ncbi:MAG TPA: ABC transporter ATP-binding protein [Polyangiaceae bacterium]|nr:ABC transporter ATP-binding protein [Polyangiaceae bacterium]